MLLKELLDYTGSLLQCWRFKDYCPNGLQIEGRAEVQRVVSGVTANQDLIAQAVALQADVLLVHHGFFWKNENPCLTGIKKNRVAALLQANISLLAYHLPLDAHPTLGNNAQLASRLGLIETARTGEQDLLCLGHAEHELTVQAWAERIQHGLHHTPLQVGDAERLVRRVAWCTGAAHSYFETAIAQGVDLFITGEISEPMVHLARESGVAYLACGHHATERYGVQALGQHWQNQLGLEHVYVDVASPV